MSGGSYSAKIQAMTDGELKATLRRQADMWFNNDNRMVLDELLKRFDNKRRIVQSAERPEK